MHALHAIGAAFIFVHATAAWGQAAGDMRMLIAPNAAIDGPTYEQYQSCLARVPLNQGLKAVADAREGCKQKALQRAYRIPPRSAQTTPGAREVPTVQERATYQAQQLERLKQ